MCPLAKSSISNKGKWRALICCAMFLMFMAMWLVVKVLIPFVLSISMWMVFVLLWSIWGAFTKLALLGHFLETCALIYTDHKFRRQLLNTLDLPRLKVRFVPFAAFARRPFTDFPFSWTWLCITAQDILVQDWLGKVLAALVHVVFDLGRGAMLADTTNYRGLNATTAWLIACAKTDHFPHIFWLVLMMGTFFGRWCCY